MEWLSYEGRLGRPGWWVATLGAGVALKLVGVLLPSMLATPIDSWCRTPSPATASPRRAHSTRQT